MFGTKRKSLFQEFDELQESRKEKCNLFMALKEGLEKDNEKLNVIEEEAAEQIEYLKSLLDKVNIVRDKNDRTIEEINRIVG